MADETRRNKRNDIGFTFEEVGIQTLENGLKVPKFDGRPNNLEAHKKLMDAIEREEK